jgi:sigma-B regulation protein RsbU (phosphoserine phosphatase)
MKRVFQSFHATRLMLGVLLACSIVLLFLFVLVHVQQRLAPRFWPEDTFQVAALLEDVLLGLSVLSLALLFGMVVHVIRRVFLPLQQLAKITRAIADDPFHARPLLHGENEELQELRDSFIYMQEKIIQSMEELKRATIEKEQIESEIRVAQRIQERFLPVQNRLHERRFTLYASLSQSKSVGGDMYSYFVKRNKLYFLMGDVQGHGIPAALYMASISTLFNYVAYTKHSTSEICDTLNAHVCRNAGDDMFITMFVGILNLDSGILNYSNAGHPFPIIRKGGGRETTFLRDSLDMPLGVTENAYMEDHVQLERGDMILIYTDGVPEAQDPSGKFYGKDRLLQFAKNSRHEIPEDLVHELLADLKDFSGNASDGDDLALISIRFHDTVFY